MMPSRLIVLVSRFQEGILIQVEANLSSKHCPQFERGLLRKLGKSTLERLNLQRSDDMI